MKGVISLAFDNFLDKTEGTVTGLQIAKGEDANLPCYFTPHFFAVETADGLFVSNTQLTLRQIIALLEEKGYNYNESKVHYSLKEIKAEQPKTEKKHNKRGK
jgi:hypothetical protein